jgi:hypothetical protein
LKSEQSKTSGFITDMHDSPEHRPASSRIEIKERTTSSFITGTHDSPEHRPAPSRIEITPTQDSELHHRLARQSRAST